jgi:phosphoribosylcarboxyaminoimidazole (NCAIR) mutase
VRVLAHDPQVDRAGKSLAMILLVRGLVAAGASAELVHLVAALAHVPVPGV